MTCIHCGDWGCVRCGGALRVEVRELKTLADQVRAYHAQFPAGLWVQNGISGPGLQLLKRIDQLAERCSSFATAERTTPP